ncbi:fungal zn(2)-Cys(6) binuclear cluster domain-containing protein [Rhizoctonia solani AG-1 IA]|uniref:Fungal zn(2)-Cys(6) binuclear cluster domain-containing protein n=1 Tax=Thanatephorus cucumeris (strain AG1-IA) TaxID=983506 RepID=L8WP36_THACA|nr:fungal zn(2)-Cys(6) binuclear cluster domain-containing protein [Rhizoctonia solani AG-1 IA]
MHTSSDSHKKCDRRKPICDRCSKGGYECLGYDHNISAGYTDADDEPLPLNRLQSESSSSLSSPHSSGSGIGNRQSVMVVRQLDDAMGARSIYGVRETTQHLIQPNTAHIPQENLFDTAPPYYANVVAHGDPPPTRPKHQPTMPITTSPHITNTAISQVIDLSTDHLLFALASQIPQGVPLPPDIRDTAEYVMSRRFLGQTAWRLSTCNFARQGLLIYAKIRDSILEGSDSGNESTFARWIEGHEQRLSTGLNQSLTPYELHEADSSRCAGILHQDCFLETVYSDPTLWSTEQDPSLVSIAHLLSSSRYGPANYMLMDVVASMIYGVPHIMQYNADVEPFHTQPHSAEWMNCFPGEFLILLAKINICRDQRSVIEDWLDIERRLISWEPRPKFEPEGLDSSKSVAWLALQETWRHTLLIYLYLVSTLEKVVFLKLIRLLPKVLYGVPTDDSRIQTSIRQIFQILGVIRRQDPPIANAGICSRTEKRRRLVRERLGCVAETRLWVVHGPDIVPILDHLWLGAAVGGNPVTWSDYVHSRHSMLPLSG